MKFKHGDKVTIKIGRDFDKVNGMLYRSNKGWFYLLHNSSWPQHNGDRPRTMPNNYLFGWSLGNEETINDPNIWGRDWKNIERWVERSYDGSVLKHKMVRWN